MFSSASQRCFDGIGVLNIDDKYFFTCWEAKFLKSLCAFSLKMVEPHQDAYLRAYAECENIKTLVILGVDIDRNDKRAYIFIGLSPQSDFPFLGITPGHNSLAFKISLVKRI